MKTREYEYIDESNPESKEHWGNLIFSYSVDDDNRLDADGHLFLGAGADKEGKEVHVFLHKDKGFAHHNEGSERKAHLRLSTNKLLI